MAFWGVTDHAGSLGQVYMRVTYIRYHKFVIFGGIKPLDIAVFFQRARFAANNGRKSKPTNSRRYVHTIRFDSFLFQFGVAQRH